ncbi:hypothetical protein DEO72_LG10g2960 [Vigna unguiculata]|uniref:Uncharacterized protein n=1 Tax=Vigna unguiculata TaxID=3917 RepID=A0A4D6NG96_VIGUN|nr:hypothetical protein DEO72_LG10g2960 [Vigna unguiculata]
MHFCVFWVPGRGTAWRHTPGRQATQGVLTNYWVGWLNRQAARGNLTRSGFFWHFRLNLVGAKVSGNYYGVILMISSGYNHVIEGLNEWNSAYEFRVECVISVFMI